METFIVTDLGFGDSGKGTVVDYLGHRSSAQSPLVVRYNGGPQAAHNVVRDGLHHTFAQWGSATFNPECETFLSKYMLINPINMINEEAHLSSLGVTNAFDRLILSPACRVITPYHVAYNRVLEMSRGDFRHGSCGQGVGTTVEWYLAEPDNRIVWDTVRSTSLLRQKLTYWRDRLYRNINSMMADGQFDVGDELDIFEQSDIVDRLISIYQAVYDRTRTRLDHGMIGTSVGKRTVIFEGAQGVLLDEWHGFNPYTTYSTTTTEWAWKLLDRWNDVESIGVIRSYMTRHGAGPLVSEDTLAVKEPHNGTGEWQGAFRTGWLDMVALRYSLDVADRIDSLAVTHLDQFPNTDDVLVCEGYQWGDFTSHGIAAWPKGNMQTSRAQASRMMIAKPVYETVPRNKYLDHIMLGLQRPIRLESHGPTGDDKVWIANP